VIQDDAEIAKYLSAKEINRLFNPKEYLGVADELIDRVLQAHASRKPKSASKAADSHAIRRKKRR